VCVQEELSAAADNSGGNLGCLVTVCMWKVSVLCIIHKACIRPPLRRAWHLYFLWD
jgi:hypothetical protein